ncbi:NAD(P)/FAD-dependent oxidoreductase [Salinicola aestuarinus]|uniref:NAD(P)/FAD-dependent oxidoreductase n=1 Tax=Salinicola aestuarinus TaxID=1949082 RepID=UPI0013004A6B|nr:FAD-dependent oxidoreductase [Salinicola aestuarinus]
MPKAYDASPSTTPRSPHHAHVVLVGSGATHFYVAAQCARLTRAGARVTLVTREPFAFPDWLGGMLGGEWQRNDVLLDPAHIERHGGEFRRAEVTRIDLEGHRLTLDDGSQLDYDWLSLDRPARVDPQTVPGFYTAQAVHDTRVESLWGLRQVLETHLADAEATLPNVVVLGGGPPGVEYAANLLALGERYGRRLPVALIETHRRALPGACDRANRWLARRLDQRGLQLELVANVTRYEDGQLVLDDGSWVAADRLLVVDSHRHAPQTLTPTGDEPSFGERASPRDPAVHDRLVTGDDSDEALPLPARERAALLIDRLQNALADGAPDAPRSPASARWQALNLGDLRDIAWRGRLWCRGRWVRRLKHRRDRAEVDHFRGGG